MNEYKFTETWFDIAIPTWSELFNMMYERELPLVFQSYQVGFIKK